VQGLRLSPNDGEEPNFVVWCGKFEFLGFTLKEPNSTLFVQVKLHTPQGFEDLQQLRFVIHLVIQSDRLMDFPCHRHEQFLAIIHWHVVL
jgi:hypothetical protein